MFDLRVIRWWYVFSLAEDVDYFFLFGRRSDAIEYRKMRRGRKQQNSEAVLPSTRYYHCIRYTVAHVVDSKRRQNQWITNVGPGKETWEEERTKFLK